MRKSKVEIKLTIEEKQKLEEIKSKPEHIRIRYVWFSVIVSMVFIVIIWFFSMQSRILGIRGFTYGE